MCRPVTSRNTFPESHTIHPLPFKQASPPQTSERPSTEGGHAKGASSQVVDREAVYCLYGRQGRTPLVKEKQRDLGGRLENKAPASDGPNSGDIGVAGLRSLYAQVVNLDSAEKPARLSDTPSQGKADFVVVPVETRRIRVRTSRAFELDVEL